jgi:hypothetical protein
MVSQEAAADLARERGRQEVARGKRQLPFSQGAACYNKDGLRQDKAV